MADPILITQIINSLGLSGKEAEQKRLELEKLTNDELTKLIANHAEFNKTDIGGFKMLENEKNGVVFNPDGIFAQNISQNQELEGFSRSSGQPAKTSTYAERKEAREFVQNYLFDIAQNAESAFYNYGADYGALDRIWSGLKNIANTFDLSSDGTAITTVKELKKSLSDEFEGAEKLKNIEKQGAFEVQFEKLRGLEFDAAKILDFKEKSEKYLEISIYKEKYDNLNRGIKELENIYKKEQSIRILKERGQIVPDSALPEVSFDEKFAQIIDEYCSGDENLKKQLLEQISGGISSKSELSEKQNFLAALNTLKSSTNQAYEQKLAGKSFETYQKEYKNAYKSALGGSNPVEFTEQWVENQKQGAAGVKMAVVIASTAALGGSSLISASVAKLAQNVGTNAAANIVKLGMTAFGTAENTALDYANAFSSESGLTTAKNAEILASAKNALPYAFFGAYVSGPMGSKIANALKGSGTAPKILEKAFSAGAKTAGFTTEISTDTLFELAISDTTF